MGVSRGAVRKKAKKMGLVRSPGTMRKIMSDGAAAAKEERRTSSIDETRRLFALGLPYTEIGKKMGISTTTASVWGKKIGLTRATATGRGQKDRAELIRMWRLGVPVEEIMEKTGILTRTTLMTTVRRLGLPRRDAEPPEELFQGGEQLHGPPIDS